MPAHLSVPPGHQGQHPWQKMLALEGSYSTHPTTRDTSHVGPQLNRAFEKVLLWWPEQEKGSGAPAASVSARKPSKHERSMHGRTRKGRRNWHQVRGNLSHSPTCASLHSSPSPKQTHSLVTASFHLHVCYARKRGSSSELDKVSCDLCDEARPDTIFHVSLMTPLSNLSMSLKHRTNNG